MACAMHVVTTAVRATPVPTPVLAAVLAAAGLAPASLAQDRREPSPNAVPELVDQRVADRNSLGQSLRVMQVDLSPHGFERVYKVPGRDDLLMRTNGALYAVYSQSAYAADTQRKGAIKAIVPAATIFYIGRPDFSVIRSTGVRDISFTTRTPDASPMYGKRLESMPGVARLDGTPIDGRAGLDARVDTQMDANTGDSIEQRSPRDSRSPRDARAAPSLRTTDPRANDEHTSHPTRPPQEVAPDAAAHPTDATAAPAAPDAQPATPRESRPGFNERIDELMRRAKKAQ
jgi:hypothetical protein